MGSIPKFIFVSNYINHHQLPFCKAMWQLLKGDFVFIQTEPMEEERIRMGWAAQVDSDFVKYYYKEPELCREWIAACKVVLFGGTDEESYIVERLKAGKSVIRYSERLYKTGQWKAVSPRGLLKKYKDHTCYRKQNVYMLCSGAYVAADFHIVRAYPNKCLRWGYFPETRHYDVEQLMDGKKARHILWAGRFLDWKHPELPLKTAKYLKDKGYSFHMDMIGGGELEKEVWELYETYQLQDCVTMQGYCTPEKVRRFMEQADIFLQTSDRQEGWGAVVNEAMNSGCAVIGNHMIGAVPFLIQQERNGMIYQDGREEMLYSMTEELLKDRDKCQELGKNALQTICQEWNAETAAKRLVQFCLKMDFLQKEDVTLQEMEQMMCLEGECNERQGMFASGPCSPAPVLNEKYVYGALHIAADIFKYEI